MIGLAATPAFATMPGYNGAITFSTSRYSWNDHELYTMNPDGSDPRRISLHTGNDTAPSWSPDGTKIAFQTTLRNSNIAELYTMNADGTNQTRVNVTGTPSTVSWSPDGTKLVYSGNVGGLTDIYTVNIDGTNQQRLTTAVNGDFWPSWSPDGTKIVFQSQRDGTTNNEIYIMNADGTNQTRLTNTAANIHDVVPDFSPDGTKLSFVSNQSGEFEIYTMDLSGGSVTKISTLSPSLTSNPPLARWSPDGTKFVFSRQTGSILPGTIYQIFTMNADGTNVTALGSPDAYFDTAPSWQPLSQPFSPSSTPARASILSFSLLGTHPEAAAQPTTRGKRISELLAYNGKLYPSYGDATENKGPVSIDIFDLASNSFSGNLLTMQTENLSQFKRLSDGTFYTLTGDPIPLTGNIASSSDSATWTLSNPITARHLFDIERFGGDLFLAGAQGNAGFVLRSNDNGVSWQPSLSQTSPYTTNVRFNWIIPFQGKLYTQAGTPGAPLQTFDGTAWSSSASPEISYRGKIPVVFANKIVSHVDGMSAFDGSSLSKVTSFTGWVQDMEVSGDYLYVLRGNDNSLTRTKDLMNWEELGAAPLGAQSIAIYNDKIYIGGSDARLYESSLISVSLADKGAQPTLSPTGANGTKVILGSITSILLASGLLVMASKNMIYYRGRSRSHR